MPDIELLAKKGGEQWGLDTKLVKHVVEKDAPALLKSTRSKTVVAIFVRHVRHAQNRESFALNVAMNGRTIAC
jgi:hypothetical protein